VNEIKPEYEMWRNSLAKDCGSVDSAERNSDGVRNVRELTVSDVASLR
jgi:hypothetical protein